jgi:WD40 repeat protein
MQTKMLTFCAVWDLPSGHLIDIFHVKKPISSMSFSPLGDFLATTHAGTRGISLWCAFPSLDLRPFFVSPSQLASHSWLSFCLAEC